MTLDLTRRTVVTAVRYSALSAVFTSGDRVGRAAPGRWAAQPEERPPEQKGSKPEKSPDDTSSKKGGSSGGSEPKGEPVSQTAAAHGGKPTIPGPPPKKIKLALVGLGKLMVDEVLPALGQSQRCEVTALVTGNPEKGRAIARHFGIDDAKILGYGDIPRLKDDQSVEAVYIATPNTVHTRDTVAALEAGTHVCCEKPLAGTVEDCERMIRAAKQAGRTLMTAYRVHHEPINNEMRRMIREGTYGRPRFVNFDACLDVGKREQYRLSKELAGGGSVFDIGIYALNTTRWLLGESPVEASAMINDQSGDERFDEVEGYIAFQLRFPSGCIAVCTSSFGTARVNRYKVICERGWVGMEPATEYRTLHGFHGDDTQVCEIKKPFSVNQFTAELDHFARCIAEGKEVESSGEEGRKDVDFMHKIYHAARSGRRVEL
ncbi:MAG: Glucose--fructose oxidoreductase [Phycisphaerales bacterium]|nr:Glucose--fructose oxidoreductase [Phycisphaerales bacterium]